MSIVITPEKKQPKLKSPVLIEGLPGIGGVGKLAADFLVEELGAVAVATITSKRFPPVVFVNDKSIQNPFVISKELVKIIKKETRYLSTSEDKAKAIFNWIERNIDYGERKKYYGYSNTEEVLRNREGVCGEMAFLYITMARSINLKSSYVSVSKDCYRERVQHACAIVDIGHRDVLVDPAYHAYDVKHEKFKILSDAEVISRFNQWR